MRLFILGATGRTGSALVAQGLARGHEITTFGRSPFPDNAKALRILVGNPMEAKDIAAELAGNDVVLSALGGRGLGVTSVLTNSVRATIEAMHSADVRRLVILSSSLLNPHIEWFPRFLRRTFLRNHVQDQRAMESQVLGSDLDWTVVRPPRLNNDAFTGQFIMGEPSRPIENAGIPMGREDVASVMLDAAERGTHIKQIVGISGGRL